MYWIFIIFLIVILIIVAIITNQEYKESTYYQETKHSFLSVRYNRGRFGEYLTYNNIKRFEENGSKFLFNVYLPNNNSTTEIDIIMISPKGIFVFESKNYSGWIFGNEAHKYWCQTLPIRGGKCHKEHFYNPIMQNHSHINHLRKLIGMHTPIKSIIVFSNKCTLKKITIHSKDVCVVQQKDTHLAIENFYNQTHQDCLSEFDIGNIYDKLYPFTKKTQADRLQHISDVQNALNNHYQSTNLTISKYTKDAYISNKEVDMLTCPFCEGKLIIRTAKNGKNIGKKFYGCSNYPNCKYTRNIKQ